MIRLAPLGLVLLAGCPSDGNPHQLWLAPNGTAPAVKLAAEEPNPF